jgi:hypothetical protein
VSRSSPIWPFVAWTAVRVGSAPALLTPSGTRLHPHRHGQQCVEKWSPWPWLVSGLLLVTAGVALFGLLRHSRSPAPL